MRGTKSKSGWEQRLGWMGVGARRGWEWKSHLDSNLRTSIYSNVILGITTDVNRI